MAARGRAGLARLGSAEPNVARGAGRAPLVLLLRTALRAVDRWRASSGGATGLLAERASDTANIRTALRQVYENEATIS